MTATTFPLTRARLALALSGMFLMGALTGGLVSWGLARGFAPHPPSARGMVAEFRDRLHRELALTPDQKSKVEPVLDRLATEWKSVGDDFFGKLEERIAKANAEIEVVLTPDQIIKFKEMETQRKEWVRKHRERRSK